MSEIVLNEEGVPGVVLARDVDGAPIVGVFLAVHRLEPGHYTSHPATVETVQQYLATGLSADALQVELDELCKRVTKLERAAVKPARTSAKK